jgi:hypothetical protein
MDSPGKESSDNEQQLTKVLEIRLDKYKSSRDPSSRPTMSGSPLINGANAEALGAITTPERHPISGCHRNGIPSALHGSSCRSHHITSHGISCRGAAHRTNITCRAARSMVQHNHNLSWSTNKTHQISYLSRHASSDIHRAARQTTSDIHRAARQTTVGRRAALRHAMRCEVI